MCLLWTLMIPQKSSSVLFTTHRVCNDILILPAMIEWEDEAGKCDRRLWVSWFHSGIISFVASKVDLVSRRDHWLDDEKRDQWWLPRILVLRELLVQIALIRFEARSVQFILIFWVRSCLLISSLNRKAGEAIRLFIPLLVLSPSFSSKEEPDGTNHHNWWHWIQWWGVRAWSISHYQLELLLTTLFHLLL